MEDCIKISTAMDCAKNTELRSATEYLNFQYVEGWNDACKCIKELISLQCPEDVEPTHRWIPCSEKLPEICIVNGEMVNYFAYLPYFGNVDIANYHPDLREWCCYGLPVSVSHWQPLPEPPEEGEPGNG